MKPNVAEFLTGSLLLLLAAGIYVVARSIPDSILTGADQAIGPRTLPMVMSMVLGLLSLVLMASSLRYPGPAGKGDAGKGQAGRRLWLSLVLLIVYISIMPYVGYVLSTVSYLFAFMCLLAGSQSAKRFFILGIIAATSTGIVYVLFQRVFLILLPQGTLLSLLG